ncbi:MAG: oxygen-dependent coproporphyrinogen oxidase [Bacteroidia bacterium]|jgi:coproporphyrinogen III oxidase
MLSKEEITEWFKSLQYSICSALEKEDGKGKFEEENWTREEGGGGRTRILQDGNVIEKGGVNFSAVHGELPEKILSGVLQTHAVNKPQTLNTEPETLNFYATGVSIVIHPHNPMVPIIHMNVRYFEMNNGTWWFGGGIDLTPHYVNEKDAAFFHNSLKGACDKHNPNYYPEFKKWADDYFFIPHRNETRGIGGIFFDRLTTHKNTSSASKQDLFAFVQEVGNAFAPIYTSLMNRNKNKSFTEANKQWQLIRRGRYVEFNLVYDKGTKFGLETNGRIESILMSLPQTANWIYNFKTQPGSPEEKTLSLLKKGINWAN